MNKTLILGLPLVAIALVVWLSLQPTRTDVIDAPGPPDLNTQLWSVQEIEDAETLLVQQGREQRRVKLCGINPNETESIRVVTELIGDNGEVEIAFLGKQNEAWVGEVWVNPEEETEELLNGLLIFEGAADVDESEWMLCPNQPSMDAAFQLRRNRR